VLPSHTKPLGPKPLIAPRQLKFNLHPLRDRLSLRQQQISNNYAHILSSLLKSVCNFPMLQNSVATLPHQGIAHLDRQQQPAQPC